MIRVRHVTALFGLTFLMAALVPGIAAASTTVHVSLVDKGDGGMGMKSDVSSVKAGSITFDVTNKSKVLTHEFLIAHMKGTPDTLPYDDSRAGLKESAMKGVKELGDLEPGKSGTMTMNLTAGKYIMFCNLPGHFKLGMYHVLKVTP